MIRAVRCSVCGVVRVRSRRPLEDATIAGAPLVSVYRFDPASSELHTWDLQVIRAGESVTPCGDHRWAAEPSAPDVADVERELAPEDRIVLGADARASLVRRVMACTFATLTNAQTFADAVRDAIDTFAPLVELDGARLVEERDRVQPVKHPTLNQWACRVRPRLARALRSERAAEVLLVSSSPFWRVDLSTSTTRLGQLRTRLATLDDLPDAWGL